MVIERLKSGRYVAIYQGKILAVEDTRAETIKTAINIIAIDYALSKK